VQSRKDSAAVLCLRGERVVVNERAAQGAEHIFLKKD